MNKLMILIGIILLIIFSGCIDERHLEINKKYTIINIQYIDSIYTIDEILVTFLNNDSIMRLPIYLQTPTSYRHKIHSSRGNFTIDNETYMKVVYINRADEYDIGNTIDDTYTEIHITENDLKSYFKK